MRILLIGSMVLSSVIAIALTSSDELEAQEKKLPFPLKVYAGGFGGRSGVVRAKLVSENGGNETSEAAVATGLKWLANHQAPNGSWSLAAFSNHGKCNCTGSAKIDNEITATALALLPFLGTGHRHKGTGEYAKEVDRGLKFLLIKQQRDGSLDGNVNAHALGTIALGEAYALTSDPALREPALRAINHLVSVQAGDGGWRKDNNDVIEFGWPFLALMTGQRAGLSVPPNSVTSASKWLDSIAKDGGSRYGDGAPMTALGILCKEFLELEPTNAALVSGADALAKLGPRDDDVCFNHFTSQSLFHLGGERWNGWNTKMRDKFTESQDSGAKAPHQKGSWFNDKDENCGRGGRIMTTSLSLLTLEVYYRHLRIYRANAVPKK